MQSMQILAKISAFICKKIQAKQVVICGFFFIFLYFFSLFIYLFFIYLFIYLFIYFFTIYLFMHRADFEKKRLLLLNNTFFGGWKELNQVIKKFNLVI